MRKSRLPEGGINKFQKIKNLKIELIKNGVIKEENIIDLSVGQPKMVASIIARKAASITVLSPDTNIHDYQDNVCAIQGFPNEFVETHMRRTIREDEDALAIPGIKSMFYVIPMACGSRYKTIVVALMTKPGYPTPEDACAALKNVEFYQLPLNEKNKFLFSPKDIKKGTDLIITNFPNNPTGQTATKKWWRKICKFCKQHNIRIYNDAAYAMLSSINSCTLAEVALEFSNLSWAEGYSASKIVNFTGWRVGAIVGSKDFVGDIRKEKGNFDSGLVAFAAAGVLAVIRDGKQEIETCRISYVRKQNILVKILVQNGMKLVVKPKATFFSLWHTPKIAFGQVIESAEKFNNLMIQHTGIVGVPFDPGYIRYCVTGDIKKDAKKIAAAFKKANISY